MYNRKFRKQISRSSKLIRCSTLADPVAAVIVNRAAHQLTTTTREKFTITDVYQVASKAKSKLGDEADCADHNLRRMVGHANLLDSLILTLFDSEIEREDWLNQNIRAVSERVATRCMKWIDRVLDDLDERESDESETEERHGVDSYSVDLFSNPLCRVKSKSSLSGEELVEVQEIEVLTEKLLIDEHNGNLTLETFQNSESTAVHVAEPNQNDRPRFDVSMSQTVEVGVLGSLIVSS